MISGILIAKIAYHKACLRHAGLPAKPRCRGERKYATNLIHYADDKRRLLCDYIDIQLVFVVFVEKACGSRERRDV